MTFLAPVWLLAAASVSGVVVLLHFFARRRPNELVLPTARFIPPHSAQSTTRTLKPNDILLMLLRVAMVLVAGAALAKPVLAPRRQPRAGIVLADVSRATPSIEELRRRVASVRRQGDVVIPFDSAAHRDAGDSVSALSGTRGSISSAMIVALETARTMRTRADSVELTIISAVRKEELDRATPLIRALWPGRIIIDRLASESVAVASARVEVRGEGADPLVAAARLHLGRGGTRDVRIVRDRLTPGDSAWARESGRVLVVWPARSEASRARADTATTLVAENVVLIAPLVRFGAPPTGSVVARWADGEPAATELRAGSGCIRTVAVGLPGAGDLVLRPEFGRLLRALTQPCEGTVASNAASATLLASLAGSGPLASGRAFPAPVQRSSLAPWLLALALLLALIEPFVRRGASKA